MKNQKLITGKKLNKKELKTILGGRLDCYAGPCMMGHPCEQIPAGVCIKIHPGCAQEECRPRPELID